VPSHYIVASTLLFRSQIKISFSIISTHTHTHIYVSRDINKIKYLFAL